MGATGRLQKITAVLTGPVGKGLAEWVCGVLVAFGLGWLLARGLLPTLCAATRYAGMMLQILGVSVVVHGLMKKREGLGRLPILEAILRGIRRVWARLVALVKPPRRADIKIQLQDAMLVAEGQVVAREERASPTWEERVTALEREVKHLRSEVDTKIQGVRGEVAIVTNALQQEQQERRAADEKAERLINEMEIGRLHIEMVGLFWVILGILCTSMPAELAAKLSLLVRVWGLTSGCS